jgi:hypothetical protein
MSFAEPEINVAGSKNRASVAIDLVRSLKVSPIWSQNQTLWVLGFPDRAMREI